MKKVLSFMIILCLLLSNFTLASENKPSEWAEESIVELKAHGTFDQNAFKNYTENITRKDFILFAVRIYEMFKGEEITPDPSITFNDTDDVYALKGATVGITSGIGQGNFGPNQLLTREQLAVLMMNTIKLAGIESKPATEYKFADESTFSDWAKESIYLAKANNIISGVGNDIFNPRANATVETAIVISNRILKENDEFVSKDIVKAEPINSTDSSAFEYKSINNQATITGYSGTSKDVVIPSEIEGLPVTTIGDWAFYSNQLTSVVIPDSVTTIGDRAFYSNQLTSVVIPDSVTTIGESAFSSNQLTTVVIPDSVTTIGDSAFSSNQLTTVVIPNSVTTIGNNAFASNQLTTVVIPDSVTTLSYGAFWSNKLTSVVIPDSVKTINSAFYDNQLTSVEIPNSVTTIDDRAFFGNKLTSVVIPDSVKIIGKSAFSSNQLTSVVIGNSVTTIGYNAFRNNELTSVVIPDSVTTIGDSAFYENQLTTVEIPNSVTTIGYNAFRNNELTSVVIPDSVTTIGDSAFYENQLTTVMIPKYCEINPNSFDENVEIIRE